MLLFLFPSSARFCRQSKHLLPLPSVLAAAEATEIALVRLDAYLNPGVFLSTGVNVKPYISHADPH